MASNSNSINIMENNAPDINNNYFSMALSSYSNYNNNKDTITEIVKSINDNLSYLNYIHNQLNTSNNLNQENLIKNEELIKMQNEDLMKQLRELEVIQSTISNKDRYIDQVNDNISNQNLNIKVLVVSILLAILLLAIIVLFGYGIFQYMHFITLMLIIVICYFILFFYAYNIFYFRDAINQLGGVGKNISRLNSKLENWSKTAGQELRNELYGLESTWINNHCDCPPQTEEDSNSNNNNDIYAEDANVSQSEIPGYFYYDGTAPQQLLLPTPLTQQLNENIEWVDHADYKGKLALKQSNDGLLGQQNNYYNAISTNKFRRGNIINNLQNKLDTMIPSYLVNDKTSTTNL